jgi:hypothetical protein
MPPMLVHFGNLVGADAEKESTGGADGRKLVAARMIKMEIARYIQRKE